MDWQTSATLFILAIAAGILLMRVGAFLRSGKIGSCGSCAGCGDSAQNKDAVQLVPLGIGITPMRITASFRKTSDASAEKTG